MKKVIFIVILLVSAIVSRAQVQSPPYQSTMYGENSGWTVINVDETTETWVDDDWTSDFKGTSFTEGKEIDLYKEVGDDWLISPAITLQAGKEYKVAFWSNVKSGYDNLSLSWADSNTIESLSAEGAKIYEYVTETWGWTRNAVVITPTETKDYYFGFHATCEYGKDYIRLTGFEIKENVFVPGAPTNLAVAPDLNGALEATVTWTLPTTDADGVALPADAVIENVKLYRDGTLLKNLPGNTASFVDTEAEGLTAGKHTYGVAVTINGVTSATTEVTSRYIGPISSNELPWTAGINSLSADDFLTFYTIIKGSASTVPGQYGWALKNGRLQFDPRSKFNTEDDWLIFPRIKVTNPGIYQVRLKSEYSGECNTNLEVYMGDGRTIESMTKKVGEFVTLPSTSSDAFVVFEIEQPGEYYISLHACRVEPDNSKNIYIDEITIESSEALPLPISDLAAVVEDANVTLTWTAPAVLNTGKAIDAIEKITLYRNDEVLAEITENIVPGSQMQYVDTPQEGGIFTYYAVPQVDGKNPELAGNKVTTPWVGDKLQQLPYDLDFSQSVDLTLQKSFWTIYNNDNDSYTWSIKSTGMTLTLDDYDGGESNDMLVSPPFMIEPGKYIATLSVKGGESRFPLQVGFVAEGEETPVIDNPLTIELSGKNSYADYPVEIETELNGRYCLAIYSNSEYDYDPYNVVMNRIQLIRDPNSPIVGIESAVVDSETENVEYYDITGQKVVRPNRGSIYIVRTSDGNVRKMIFR